MKLKQTTINSNKKEIENVRFTTLINPNLLSQIKLISYISNKKLYDVINLSLQHYIDYYNQTSNTNITDIIQLQQNNIENDSNIQDEIIETDIPKK